MSSSYRRSALSAALMFAVALPASAQQTAAPISYDFWSAYLGCWATSTGGVNGPMICIVPTDSLNVVEMKTVRGDSVVASYRVDATGNRVPVTRDGCTGWEQGTWSIDERRLYTHSEYTCASGITQKSNGIFAMSDVDGFSRVESINTRGKAAIRLINFTAVPDSSLVPAQLVTRLPAPSSVATLTARVDRASEVSIADVADAAKNVDASVVEAWLGDRGQQFAINAKDLRALGELKVSGPVIDMLVALSHPSVFAVGPGARPGVRPNDPFQRADRRMLSPSEYAMYLNSTRRAQTLGLIGGGWFPYDSFGLMYGSAFWSPYAFGNQNFGFGGFGNYYNGPGWYGYGNGGYNGPYVVTPREPAPPASRGTAVNGYGYTQSGGSSSGIARPSGSVSNEGYSSPSGSSGASGSSGSSGASGGASSGGGEQRTAKERP